MSNLPAWHLNGDIRDQREEMIFSFFQKLAEKKIHFQGWYIILI